MNEPRTVLALALAILLLAAVSAADRDDRGLAIHPSWQDDGTILGNLGGQAIQLGTYHALLIGINKYRNPDFAPNLRTALTDVHRLRQLLIV